MSSRTFLITGASKGIGRALSERLIRAGHQVVGVARQGDANFPGELVALDLADRDATERTLRALSARHAFGGVVNNVALVRPQRIGEINLDDLDAMPALNLHPAVQAVQALLPGMRERG